MRIDQSVLGIDPEAEAVRICNFIRHQVESRLKRKGVVVGLSGGVDSALLACLCVRTFGPEKVCGVILPEKESSPESAEFAVKQAEVLGLEPETVDITTVLSAIGVYENRDAVIKGIDPGFDPERDACKISLPQNLLDRDSLNVFSLIVEKPNGETKRFRLKPQQIHEIASYQNIKQRTRMIHLYHFAEKLHYVVGGTTNLPEMDQGFFVKHGDGGVDIEPLAHLYKTQVFCLGAHVGVIQEILDREPTPDTWSGHVNDEEFYFRMPFETVDLLLHCWNHGIPPEEAGAAFDLTSDQVERAYRDFRYKRQTSRHLRQLPPSLVDDNPDPDNGFVEEKPA